MFSVAAILCLGTVFYDSTTGLCYSFRNSQKNWSDARLDCISNFLGLIPGTLAVFPDQATLIRVGPNLNIPNNVYGYWIGMRIL